MEDLHAAHSVSRNLAIGQVPLELVAGSILPLMECCRQDKHAYNILFY